MKVRASGTSFLASGTILARVVLPKGVNVGLDVHRVFPDVLVFDGEISLEAIASFRPPSTPLPDPLPEHAFGHIVPEDWLPALSVIDKSEDGEGMAYAVTAKIVDIPLDVLPGRQKQFSNFVSKVSNKSLSPSILHISLFDAIAIGPVWHGWRSCGNHGHRSCSSQSPWIAIPRSWDFGRIGTEWAAVPGCSADKKEGLVDEPAGSGQAKALG